MVAKVVASTKAGSAFGALAAAYALKVPVEYNQNDEDVAFNKAIGPIAVLKDLAKTYPQEKLAGSTDSETNEVNKWVEYASTALSTADYKTLAPTFTVLDEDLSNKQYLVGTALTIADYAAWGALKASPIFMKLMKSGKIPGANLVKWFTMISGLPQVEQAVLELNEAKSATRNRKDQGNLEIGLKDAEQGKVVTRFPPEPSGYLHIGHAKAALLNDYFAKAYNGKLIVRFDDTNPSKEKTEFEESIKEDLLLIGIKGDVISYTSDYFDQIYELAVKMIKAGKAYVDDTDVDTMREQRMKKVASPSRANSVEENLRRFEEMKNATEYGLKCVLRAKIDMTSKNGTMRDPTLFRCNLTPHHRTGSKWKIYPTYDFACPIVDSLEGVTHALRTNEYRDRDEQYQWMLDALELRKVHIWEYSRINFVYTLLSKRKLTWFVEQGLVSGWDDPRFPTIRGIRRRGMTIDALKEYILMQGASQKDLLLEWDKIWSVNKKVVDPIAPRHTVLAKENLVKVNVLGEKVETVTKEMPKHKKNPDVGNKQTTFSGELYLEQEDAKDLTVDEEVTFMDWGNVIVAGIHKDDATQVVTSIDITLNLAGDFKKTKKKLTWLSRIGTTATTTPIPVTLFDYDYLITKPKLDEADNVADFVTPTSEFRVDALGDSNVRDIKKGEIVQFERKGYYICDKAFDGSEAVFIHVPDGKVATMQSKADEGKGKGEKREKKEKKDKKEKKGKNKDQGAASGIKMYSVKPVYADDAIVNMKNVSKMYDVKPVYGFEVPTLTASSATPEISSEPANPKKVEKEAIKDKVKKEKREKPAKAPADGNDEASLVSKLDICVGKILTVKPHPDADSLYVEEIDCGEKDPRVVVSGLRKFMTEDEMKGKLVCIVKNMKPAAMRGIKSHAMVLCASPADHSHVEFLVPPPGSEPGDKVYFPGHEGEPEEVLNPKKKIFETVAADFKTRDDLVAVWRDVEWTTKRGVVKAASVKGANIK
ncbi:tRNA synthetases class I, catalytic domain-containing protein [Gaertneriomyces semiglobifer]|nr:tRNA synthetases class I, catalytic domain-containing protein [Gaertneriomyces semiglobifer]